MSLIIKKNTTFKIPRTGLFLPSSLDGLALWLKADAGVTKTSAFISQVEVFDAGIQSSEGTYTRTSGGTTQFDGPNGNYIYTTNGGAEWAIFDTQLYNPETEQNGADSYYTLDFFDWSISGANLGTVPAPNGSITGLDPGGAVTIWEDQSGNGNNAIAENTAAQPTYNSNSINGKPSIDFNGIENGNVLTIANSSSLNVSALTIFAVIQRDGDGFENDILFIKNGNTLSDAAVYGIVPFSGDPWTVWANIGNDWESLGDGSNITDNNPHIIGFSLDNTDGLSFQDGSSTAISYGVIQTSTGDLQIGGYNKSFDRLNGEHFYGKIAEFIFYDRALTTLERQQVEAYLNQKYSIY